MEGVTGVMAWLSRGPRWVTGVPLCTGPWCFFRFVYELRLQRAFLVNLKGRLLKSLEASRLAEENDNVLLLYASQHAYMPRPSSVRTLAVSPRRG